MMPQLINTIARFAIGNIAFDNTSLREMKPGSVVDGPLKWKP
jgi:hypothetical protein